MNFINDTDLAQRLKKNQVSPKEGLLYFLTFSIITSLLTSSTVSNFLYSGFETIDLISDVLDQIILIAGTFLLYRTNLKGDGKEFIGRVICLSVPVTFQLLIISFFLGFILLVPGLSGGLFEVLLKGVVLICYYIRLNRSLKIASH